VRTLGPIVAAAVLSIGIGVAAVKIADACNHYLDRQACLLSAAADGTANGQTYCRSIHR
jgi:hypothetical protein